MSPSLLEHPKALMNQLRRLAIEAGEVTLEYFEETGFVGADSKADGSPVTIADQKAEARIVTGLRDILPDVPMIGEESVADGVIPSLEGHRHFWLVDPLDGTKEFISGSGEYTVNIALIEDGRPKIGIVYAPARGELYGACGEGTAFRWLEETGTEKEIRCRVVPAGGWTVISSRSHGSGTRLEAYLSQFKVNKVVRRGSSLKICAIAAGKADLYPRFGSTCEWDTAAGHAVVNAAGGHICTFAGTELTYGGGGRKFLNDEFVCLADLRDLPPALEDEGK